MLLGLCTDGADSGMEGRQRESHVGACTFTHTHAHYTVSHKHARTVHIRHTHIRQTNGTHKYGTQTATALAHTPGTHIRHTQHKHSRVTASLVVYQHTRHTRQCDGTQGIHGTHGSVHNCAGTPLHPPSCAHRPSIQLQPHPPPHSPSTHPHPASSKCLWCADKGELRWPTTTPPLAKATKFPFTQRPAGLNQSSESTQTTWQQWLLV